MLGREPRRLGGIDRKAMNRQAREILEGLGLDLDPGWLPAIGCVVRFRYV